MTDLSASRKFFVSIGSEISSVMSFHEPYQIDTRMFIAYFVATIKQCYYMQTLPKSFHLVKLQL